MGRRAWNAGLGLYLMVCGASAWADQPPAPGNPALGHELAQTWCGNCHQVSDADKAHDAAPTFRAIANDPGKDADYLRGFLHRPHPPMPPLELSRVQIDDLIAYIGSLKRPK